MVLSYKWNICVVLIGGRAAGHDHREVIIDVPAADGIRRRQRHASVGTVVLVFACQRDVDLARAKRFASVARLVRRFLNGPSCCEASWVTCDVERVAFMPVEPSLCKSAAVRRVLNKIGTHSFAALGTQRDQHRPGCVRNRQRPVERLAIETHTRAILPRSHTARVNLKLLG